MIADFFLIGILYCRQIIEVFVLKAKENVFNEGNKV